MRVSFPDYSFIICVLIVFSLRSRSCDRVLGIEKDADEGQIKKGYRAMALKWHPGIVSARFVSSI